MMYGFFPAFGSLVLWGVHGLSSLAGVVGLILLIGWALKHAPARSVKHWALWLIGIGLALSLLTMPVMFGGFGMGRGCFGGGDAEQVQLRNRTFRGWMMGLYDDDQPTAASSSSAKSSARSGR